MRKADVDTALLKFRDEFTFLMDFYTDSIIAFRGHSSSDSYSSKQAELCFHKLYVSFEVYLSELFVALVNIDPSQYQKNLHSHAMKAFPNTVPQWLKDRTEFKTEKHIKLDDVRIMLDADQANITFKTVKDMKEKAKKWISAELSKPILSLRPEDENLIHAAIAMRNFIAHESQKSRRLMNEALRNLGDHPDHSDLKISHKDVRTVGAYLKAMTSNGPRFLSLSAKLGSLAERLDPNVRSIKARKEKQRRMNEF